MGCGIREVFKGKKVKTSELAKIQKIITTIIKNLKTMKADLILKNYEIAKERYAALGVDTDKAIATLEKTPISLHCWQADDVVGF